MNTSFSFTVVQAFSAATKNHKTRSSEIYDNSIKIDDW